MDLVQAAEIDSMLITGYANTVMTKYICDKCEGVLESKVVKEDAQLLFPWLDEGQIIHKIMVEPCKKCK